MGIKYRTGQGTSASDFTDLVVKVGDTLPIGTEVDYDGQTAPAGWQEVQNKVVLYDGKSNTSITLNDNVNNYSAIEIFYGNNGGSIFNSKKFLKGMYLGKLEYYNISTTTTAQNTQIFVKDISISGNTLSCGINRALFITGNVVDYSEATMTQGTDNLIYIYKVIGYKEA